MYTILLRFVISKHEFGSIEIIRHCHIGIVKPLRGLNIIVCNYSTRETMQDSHSLPAIF
jgi:hypothetical protein